MQVGPLRIVPPGNSFLRKRIIIRIGSGSVTERPAIKNISSRNRVGKPGHLFLPVVDKQLVNHDPLRHITPIYTIFKIRPLYLQSFPPANNRFPLINCLIVYRILSASTILPGKSDGLFQIVDTIIQIDGHYLFPNEITCPFTSIFDGMKRVSL